MFVSSINDFGKNIATLIATALLLVISNSNAYACPEISGIPDFNCDGKLQVAVMGDSIAYGFGDTKNNNRGGYVLRAAKLLPELDFVNLAVLGLRTRELLLQIDNAFKNDKPESTKEALLDADIVILDVGRNDRWLFGTPEATYRNLKRATSNIKKYTDKIQGYSPLVVTAVMLLPNRGSQGPWMKALNSIILKSSSIKSPSDLRFDLVSKRLLNKDQLHPSPAGYSSLAKTLVTYLKKKLPARMRSLRPDTDQDGVPDILETNRFGTSPDLADTDGDLISDGDELFVNGTDPLTIN